MSASKDRTPPGRADEAVMPGCLPSSAGQRPEASAGPVGRLKHQGGGIGVPTDKTPGTGEGDDPAVLPVPVIDGGSVMGRDSRITLRLRRREHRAQTRAVKEEGPVTVRACYLVREAMEKRCPVRLIVSVGDGITGLPCPPGPVRETKGHPGNGGLGKDA